MTNLGNRLWAINQIIVVIMNLNRKPQDINDYEICQMHLRGGMQDRCKKKLIIIQRLS